MLSSKNTGGPGISGGYFGKLPSFADFVKYNAAVPELLNFDKWLQEGITKLKISSGNVWEKLYRESPCFRFMYYDSSARNILTGNLYPSYDRSGRLFPFLIFAKPGTAYSVPGEFYLIPLLFKDLFASAGTIFEEIKSAGNAGELNSAFERIISGLDRNIDPAADFNNYLRVNRISGFLERNFTSGISENNFKELIPKAVSKGQNLLRSYAIKIHTTNDANIIPYDVSFWIRLFEKKNSGNINSVFWTYASTGLPAAMFIFCRKLVPVNFVDLINPLNKPEELIDIDDMNSTLSGSAYNEVKNETAFTGNDSSLYDFLNSF